MSKLPVDAIDALSDVGQASLIETASPGAAASRAPANHDNTETTPGGDPKSKSKQRSSEAPIRTSSAPPDEHPVTHEPKRDSFQPTKTTKTRIHSISPHHIIEPPKRSSEVNYPPLVLSSPTNVQVASGQQPQQPTAACTGSVTGPPNMSSPQGANPVIPSPRQSMGAPFQAHLQPMQMQGGPRSGGTMMYGVPGGASPPMRMHMPPGAQISHQGQIVLTGSLSGEMPHGAMSQPSGMAFRAAGPGEQLYPVQIGGENIHPVGQPLLYASRGYMPGYPQQQPQQLQQGGPRDPMSHISQQHQQQPHESQPIIRSSPQSKGPAELQQQRPRGPPSSPQQIQQQHQRYPSYPAPPIQQSSTDPRDPRSMGPLVGVGGAFIGGSASGQFYQPQGQGDAPRFYHDPSQAQSQLQGQQQQQQQYMFRYPVPVSMQAMPSGQPFVGRMPVQMMPPGAMGRMGGQVNIGSLQHGVAPRMAMPMQNMPQQQQQQRSYRQQTQSSPIDPRISSIQPTEEPSTSTRDAGIKSETDGAAAAAPTTTKKKYTIRNKLGNVVDMSYFKVNPAPEVPASLEPPFASPAISSDAEATPEPHTDAAPPAGSSSDPALSEAASHGNVDSHSAPAESLTPLIHEDSPVSAVPVSDGFRAAETTAEEPSPSHRISTADAPTADTNDTEKPNSPVLPTASTEVYPIVLTPVPQQSAARPVSEEMASLAVRIVDDDVVAPTAESPAPSMMEASPMPVQVDLTWRDVMSPPAGSSKVDGLSLGKTEASEAMDPVTVTLPPARSHNRHADEGAAHASACALEESRPPEAASASLGSIPDELRNLIPTVSVWSSDSTAMPTSAMLSLLAKANVVETTMTEKPVTHQSSLSSKDTTNGSVRTARSENTALKTLEKMPIDATSATLVASVDPPSANPQRGGKKATALRNSWRGGGDMLDAYTDAATPVQCPPLTTPAVAATVTVAPPEAATNTTSEPADDWEETADKITELGDAGVIPVAAAPNERRRLVPGGSSLLARLQPRLNAGPKSMQPLAKRLISKEELLKLRPTELPERPRSCLTYINITLIDERALPRVVKCMGYWNFRGEPLAQQQHQYMGGPNQGQADKRQYYQSQHGQRGDGQRDRDAPHSRGYDDGHGYGHGGGGGGRGGNGTVPFNSNVVVGWKRDSGSDRGGGGGLGRDSFFVRQRKLATDPVELLSQSVVAILNKITPQTFDKLTAQLCDIPIATSALLDKLVELVFEKAVQEQHFANLYADMCNKLERASKSWSFLQVAFDDDNKSYFWMRDLEFDNVLAGPYRSIEECTDAVKHESPMMAPVTIPFRINSIIKKNDVLIKVFQNIESETPEYFVSYMSFSDIPKENLGDKMFDEMEDAQREADKRNGMRRRLVLVCQQEFDSSTMNLGIYGRARKEEQEFKEIAKTLSLDERQARETELNENAMKLKKRMFGNIRFIGELYKKSMISTSIMNECIMYFIAERDENGEFAGFKSEHDEQGLELLCRLLKTVGGQIEAKAAKARIEVQFNWYLDHLRDLSKDKSINSRIRFSIDEVLEMRRNGWVARREQEGPATLEEIHKKIALEERSRALQQQQHQSHGGQRIVRSSTASHGPTTAVHDSGGDLRRANSIAYSSSQPQQQPYPSLQPPHKPLLSHSQHPPHLRSQPQPSGGSPVITGIMNRGSPGYVSGGRGPPPQVSSIPALPAAACATASTALSDESKDRLRSMVQDLVRTQDFAEFDFALEGFPSQAPALACLALNIAAKYLDSSKDEVHKQLGLLVERLSPRLTAARAEVEEALCTSEQLTLLYDASLDCQRAPEMLGKIIGKLVKAGACRAAVIESVATKCSTDAGAAEDCGCSLGDLVAVYARFTLAISKE